MTRVFAAAAVFLDAACAEQHARAGNAGQASCFGCRHPRAVPTSPTSFNMNCVDFFLSISAFRTVAACRSAPITRRLERFIMRLTWRGRSAVVAAVPPSPGPAACLRTASTLARWPLTAFD